MVYPEKPALRGSACRSATFGVGIGIGIGIETIAAFGTHSDTDPAR